MKLAKATLVVRDVEPGWPIVSDDVPLGKPYIVDLDLLRMMDMVWTGSVPHRTIRLAVIWVVSPPPAGWLPAMAFGIVAKEADHMTALADAARHGLIGWTIYSRQTSDCPGWIVIRPWLLAKAHLWPFTRASPWGPDIKHAHIGCLCGSLEEARAMAMTMGADLMTVREDDDDPVILESWI